jgi:predicted lipoprotein with Yx(FWY)xxD motif
MPDRMTTCAKRKRNEMSEMNDRKHARRTRSVSRRVRFVPFAGAVLAAGGLSTAIVSAGAEAATRTLVSTTHNAELGTILVSGKTVYTLKPSKVPCRAQCLKLWPAVLASKGATTTTAGPGVNASRLGTVSASKGSRQVTYRGKRLYFFIKDTSAGQVKGNNLTTPWGKWSVVVTAKPAHSSSGSGASQPVVQAPVPAAPPQPTTITAPPRPPSTTAPGIPQGNGGDQDGDNNGGASDGDGDQ